MVELKINDVESLEAIVSALQKNGYCCNSFIHWEKGKVEHFTVQIDLPEVPKSITHNTAKALEAIGRLTHGGIRQWLMKDCQNLNTSGKQWQERKCRRDCVLLASIIILD